MDRRTILAFVLIGILAFLWMLRSGQRQQEERKRRGQAAPISTTEGATPSSTKTTLATKTTSAPSPAIYKPDPKVPAQAVAFAPDGAKYETDWSSTGAGISVARLTDYKESQKADSGHYPLLKEIESESLRQALESALDAPLEAPDFKEATLSEVMDFFRGIMTGQVNFTVDPGLTQSQIRITCKAQKVTLREALRSILQPKGLDYNIWHDAIFISTSDRIDQIRAMPRFPTTLTIADVAGVLPLEKQNYSVEKSSDGSIAFFHRFPNGLEVRKQILPGANAHEMRVRIELSNTSDAPLSLSYRIYAASRVMAEGGSAAQLEGLIGYRHKSKTGIDKLAPGKVRKEPLTETSNAERPILWAGAENRYFATVLKPIIPEGKDASAYIYQATVDFLSQSEQVSGMTGSVSAADNVAVSLVSTPREIAAHDKTTDEYAFFMGPKKKDVLADYPDLAGLVDYGFFGGISKILLVILYFFYRIIPNYGVGIILLTFVVKIALHPLTRKGQIAMQRMQKLQPLIREMQAKFKNDKQRLAKEQMELFKKHGANPMTGCLPLLLQIPVFFGLFRMLQSSVDLRHEGFMLWVRDLTQPDTIGHIGAFPVNILPVLMVISWVAQQLTMPKSPDPQQAQQQKIMMFMPILFGFMMYGTMSGLTLYWLTSTFLGIVEQKIIKVEIAKMEARGDFAPPPEEPAQPQRGNRRKRN